MAVSSQLNPSSKYSLIRVGISPPAHAADHGRGSNQIDGYARRSPSSSSNPTTSAGTPVANVRKRPTAQEIKQLIADGLSTSMEAPQLNLHSKSCKFIPNTTRISGPGRIS